MIPLFNKMPEGEATKFIEAGSDILQHPKHKKNKAMVKLAKLMIRACGASYLQAQYPHEFLFVIGERTNPNYRKDWQSDRDAAQAAIEEILKKPKTK